jgi:UDP-N-acetylmuramoylalanine--D-glutamate ligase
VKIAILGLGRSGVSAAKAALSAGAEVVAVDQKTLDDPAIARAVEELCGLGVDVRPGWNRGLWETAAQTVVTSPGVPKGNDLLQAALRDGLEVISEIELAFRIAKDPIVAITGTNGKSTTSVMAWLCAKAAGFDAVLCGNIYGSGYDEVPLTEAAAALQAPVALPPASSGAGGGGPRALIAEISSFQLEWVDRFRPKAAVITNISPDHMNRYESFEEYAETKRRIYARMGPGDWAAWQDGDFRTEPPAGIRTLTYGQHGNDAWSTELRLHLFDEFVLKERLPFAEPHNFLNAMAACLLAYGLSDGKAEPARLLDALTGFKGLAHRMESLGTHQQRDVLVINNSMCTNPAAVISSSKAVQKPQRLLIGGVNKDLDFAPVGAYLRETGHRAYLFGTDGAAIAEALGGGFPVFNTLAEAFAAAAQDARSGEAIMLAPGVASMDQFADFRDRGEAFRQMALAWMNGN